MRPAGDEEETVITSVKNLTIVWAFIDRLCSGSRSHVILS